MRHTVRYEVSIKAATEGAVSDVSFTTTVVEDGDLQDQVRGVVKDFTREVQRATLTLADRLRQYQNPTLGL